ncbi:MAG: hypothetical protein V1903_02955 [Bacteroidota bacterium]
MIRNFIPALCFAFLLLILTGLRINAQSGNTRDVKTILEEYCTDIPWEEVFVHTDRSIYTAGEELWFTGYLFDRHTSQLSAENSILYFEILNPSNIPVIQKRMLIHDGVCPGNAHLPDTLSPGKYMCRVYTNWMKNFLPVNAFMKEITIVNPFRTNGFMEETIYEEKLPSATNIKFFPEGGTLINGIEAVIAVRVSDEYQRGIEFRGVVRNSRGDSITYFRTNKFGLASFGLTPSPGNSYYVLHSETVTYLPLPANEGCSLKADYLGKDIITINISETGSLYSLDNQDYTLIIHSNGSVCYSERFRIPGFSKTIILSEKGLLQGINQITLFNENMIPLCERLVCISNNEASYEMNFNIPDTCGRREKVSLSVELKSGTGESVSSPNFSISVFPESYISGEEKINDYLVFGTEFGFLPWKESLNIPDAKDIDNFLLGAVSLWIKWDEVFKGNRDQLSFSREENLHFIEGVINEREPSATVRERTLTMSIPGKVASFYYANTGTDGHFNFRLPVDQIQRNLIIQPGLEEESFSVEIQPSYSRNLPLSYSYKTELDADKSKLFSDLSARYQLNMIFGTSMKEESSSEMAESAPVKRFYGKPEIELIMSDYIKLPVMQEVFFELTPGVRLRERRSGYDMRIINPFTGTYYDEPATVLIDGVIINDLTILATLDPEIVERIDIVKTPYLTGDYIHNGIVHVITLPGKFNNITLPDYAVRLPYRVTEPVPLFSAPDYSDPLKKQSRIPDFRNTLYWNPSVKPDNEGRISLEFWTSDLEGEYLIDIQGITPDGRPVSVKKLITVN